MGSRSAASAAGAAVLAAAVLVCCVGSAPAGTSAVAPGPLLAGLNAVRARLGLGPLAANPVAAGLVAELAAGDVRDEPPRVLDSQPDCAVCEVLFRPGGGGVDPRELYALRGGRGAIGFGLWRGGWTAEENLAAFFPSAAMALDPRARTFSAAATPKGMLVVAVAVEPTGAFAAPIRWPAGPADPRRQLWAETLLPPGAPGDPVVTERRGGRDVVVAHALAEAAGLAGARLVAFGLNATLAYGHRYVARLGSAAVPFSTRSAPASFLARSWRFSALPPSARAAFLRVFRRAPLLLHRLAAELDGAVSVIGGGHGCEAADACERAANGVAEIGVGRVEPFVVLHEFGHVVWDLALDEPGRRAFEAAFARSPRLRGGCCPNFIEIFADQLAYWALGGRPRGVSSYGDPVLLDRRAFGRLLLETAAYRPASALGPLG